VTYLKAWSRKIETNEFHLPTQNKQKKINSQLSPKPNCKISAFLGKSGWRIDNYFFLKSFVTKKLLVDASTYPNNSNFKTVKMPSSHTLPAKS
jgi:hypothetical protein